MNNSILYFCILDEEAEIRPASFIVHNSPSIVVAFLRLVSLADEFIFSYLFYA